jgi:hypothetical protein
MSGSGSKLYLVANYDFDYNFDYNFDIDEFINIKKMVNSLI